MEYSGAETKVRGDSSQRKESEVPRAATLIGPQLKRALVCWP